uniref:Membrane protein ORF132 n=1 Tax=Panagrellus redivivus TaxID=6233 RepID=A0A7E4VW51_PANRE
MPFSSTLTTTVLISVSLLPNPVTAICDDFHDDSVSCVLSIVGIVTLVVLLIAAVIVMLIFLYDAICLKVGIFSANCPSSLEANRGNAPLLRLESGTTESSSTTDTSGSSTDSGRRRVRRRKVFVVDEA